MADYADLRYVPSPIPVQFTWIYTATANPSGRMQYHKIKPGLSKERISRGEFVYVYNHARILAVRPLQDNDSPVFQMEFYV